MKKKTAKQSSKTRIYTAPAAVLVTASPGASQGGKAKNKHPIGLDYKYAAQARMHKECGGDLKKFMQQCEASVKKIEREFGFKFKRGVPAGWTAPKINWPAS